MVVNSSNFTTIFISDPYTAESDPIQMILSHNLDMGDTEYKAALHKYTDHSLLLPILKTIKTGDRRDTFDPVIFVSTPKNKVVLNVGRFESFTEKVIHTTAEMLIDFIPGTSEHKDESKEYFNERCAPVLSKLSVTQELSYCLPTSNDGKIVRFVASPINNVVTDDPYDSI